MVYFVAYTFEGGTGNGEITMNSAIDLFTDIQEAQKSIGEKYNLKNVLLTNYIKLEGK